MAIGIMASNQEHFLKRINYSGNLQNVIDSACDNFGVTRPIEYSVVEDGFEAMLNANFLPIIALHHLQQSLWEACNINTFMAKTHRK